MNESTGQAPTAPEPEADAPAEPLAQRAPVRPDSPAFADFAVRPEIVAALVAAGIVRTEFLTYLPVFFAAGALCVVAAMLILSVPKPSARRIAAAMPLPARG